MNTSTTEKEVKMTPFQQTALVHLLKEIDTDMVQDISWKCEGELLKLNLTAYNGMPVNDGEICASAVQRNYKYNPSNARWKLIEEKWW
jgi:hypothetical protein